MPNSVGSPPEFVLRAAELIGVDPSAFANAEADRLLPRCLKAAKSASGLNRKAEAVALFRTAALLAPDDDALQWAAAEYVLRHASLREADEHVRAAEEAGKLGEIPGFMRDTRGRFADTATQAFDLATERETCGLIIAVAVWGARFADLLVRYGLPQLLGQRSLRTVTDEARARLIIFTSDSDAARISGSGAFAALQPVLRPAFVPLPAAWTALAGKPLVNFQLLAFCHYAAVEAGRRAGTHVALIFPDIAFNDSYLEHAWRATQAGRAVVLAAALRGHEPTVLQALEQARDASGAIRFDAASLGRLAARCVDRRWFADSDNTIRYPFHLFWRAGTQGRIGRISHPTPVLLDGRAIVGPISLGLDPIDASFLDTWLKPAARGRIERVHPGHMLLVGAEPNALFTKYARPFDEFAYAEFLAEFDSPLMRQNLEMAYRLGDATATEFEQAEHESRIAVRAALELVDAFQAGAARPAWATRREP